MKLFWSFWITGCAFFWLKVLIDLEIIDVNHVIICVVLFYLSGLMPYFLWRVL
ncbi:hypothetical protein [Enterobacter sp. PTB]|uniref:hypothetical protein n=1 Tax=Enterobacter sp. PTB TaxID=3143437 RepID=UPI003DA8F916